jgi:DnaJ-class molecular chaperone
VRGAKLEIPVPPGTTSGTVLRVQGAGEFDLDGAPPGDLLVEVSVTSDPLMTQRGHDLHLSRPVPVWLALAGGPLEVPTPHGGARVEVPAGVRDREVLRLKGWGVRSLEGSGDALVELVIEWPAHLGSEARKALRAWGTSLGVDAFPESARFEARHLVGSDS